MSIYNPEDVHMEYQQEYQSTKTWSGRVTTDASGNAVFQLLSTDGTKAYFNNIFENTINVQTWSTDRILLASSYTVSADKKTVTVAIKQNGSLLSLGLIPFTTAAAGYMVYMTVSGN